MPAPRYRLLEHTADLLVEVNGATLPELFANAAFCLSDVMLESGSVRQSEKREIEVSAADLRELLLEWLREILFLFSTGGFAVARAEVLSVEPGRVRAVLHGEPYSFERHGLRLEIKTPTYHGYVFEQTPAGCRAVVLFDV